MKPWEKYQQAEQGPWAKYSEPEPQEPEQEPYFGQQYIDPALAIGSGIAAPVIAGASSLLYVPKVGISGAAEIYEDTKDMLTYEPELEQSKQNVSLYEKYLSNIVQSLQGSYPGNVVAPLVEAGLEGTNKLADTAAEKYGPAAGTVVKTAPVALAELMALKGAGAVRPSVRMLDEGAPTPELERTLAKKGLTYQTATPETKSMVPVDIQPGLISSAETKAKKLAGDMQVKQIESGGRDSSLARLTVENGKAKTNKLGIDAINNGWEEGTVRMVDTMNPQTKEVAKDMLNMRWALKMDESNANRKYPLIKVGEEFNKRLNFLRVEANKATGQLKNLTKSDQFKSLQVDPRQIVESLRDKLDDLKITYERTENGIALNFKGSVIQENPAAQKAIKQALRLINPDRSNTAESLHLLKRQLDDLIDFKKKSKEGISEEGRRVLKALRAETNDVLRSAMPEYGQINDKLHSILTTLEDFSSRFKIDRNLYTDPSAAIGNEMRKIHTRYKAGELIDGNILDVDNLAADLGYKGDVNYRDLVQLANRMDDRFGSSKSGSFKGEIQGAMRAERMAEHGATGNKPGIIREGYGMAKDKINKMRGKDPDFDAYLSLKNLLSR